MADPALEWLDGQHDLLVSAREKIRRGARHLLTGAEEAAWDRWPGTAVHVCMISLKTDGCETPMRWRPGDRPGPLDRRSHP
jgi:hypothetical protein